MGGKKIEVEKSIGSDRGSIWPMKNLLAWIRTSIGIMAFGFLVEKFGFHFR